MRNSAQFYLRWRAVIFAGLALILTGLVISRSLADYLADTAPRLALWLNPWQADALVNLAGSAISFPAAAEKPPSDIANRVAEAAQDATDGPTNAAKDGSAYSPDLEQAFKTFGQRAVDLPSVRGWVESALIYQPLNVRALQILGQVASASNDDVNTEKFMRAAAQLSLHDNVVSYWLMRKSFQAGDYRAAIHYADVLLRTSPQLIAYVTPILALIAEDKKSTDLLENVLASDPPWREAFFQELPLHVTDARTPLDLLLALRTGTVPPTSDDYARYVNLLVSRKIYELAYYTWLQFLPIAELRTAGLLFNGDFETVPSGLPFDWQIKSGSGVTIDIVPRSDKTGGHALMVDFQYGRVDYHSVSQLTMLSPGTYEFKGEYKGQLIGPRGLKWRVVCAGETGVKIGESPAIIGMASNWTDVSFTFTVPAADCRAQNVRLDLDARMASEQLVSGSMLFDKLRISRVTNSPT